MKIMWRLVSGTERMKTAFPEDGRRTYTQMHSPIGRTLKFDNSNGLPWIVPERSRAVISASTFNWEKSLAWLLGTKVPDCLSWDNYSPESQCLASQSAIRNRQISFKYFLVLDIGRGAGEIERQCTGSIKTVGRQLLNDGRNRCSDKKVEDKKPAK